MKVSVQKGSVPLLVSFPHSGTAIPESVAERMTNRALTLPDTDWFLPRLYDFLDDLGASTVAANFSRYLIDPNRSTDGINLYPGQPTPELCPLTCFDGSPIYQPGQEPDAFEIGERTADYWRHYHDDVWEELLRLKHQHGIAVLFDAHSIQSQVPRLFPGQLPDINMGTARGSSCDPNLELAIETVLKSQNEFSHVFNGRFVGGHITRHYGQPANRIHAVQLELAKLNYMDEAKATWDETRANAVRPVLRSILESILNWIENQNHGLSL